MHGLFKKPERREVKELQIVPVIDMFTTVIFFLLMSTSFIALTKLSVPPTKVEAVSAESPVEPLAPKLIVSQKNSESAELKLSWRGKEPGEFTETVQFNETELTKLQEVSFKIVERFALKFPSESSVRLGFGSDVPYQWVVSAMDGVRQKITNIVLVSYD